MLLVMLLVKITVAPWTHLGWNWTWQWASIFNGTKRTPYSGLGYVGYESRVLRLLRAKELDCGATGSRGGPDGRMLGHVDSVNYCGKVEDGMKLSIGR